MTTSFKSLKSPDLEFYVLVDNEQLLFKFAGGKLETDDDRVALAMFKSEQYGKDFIEGEAWEENRKKEFQKVLENRNRKPVKKSKPKKLAVKRKKKGK